VISIGQATQPFPGKQPENADAPLFAPFAKGREPTNIRCHQPTLNQLRTENHELGTDPKILSS
jgi:hypothetical protein